MRARRVVGLGLCVVDHVFVVDQLDSSAVRSRYSEHRVLAGGMTGNALAQAAALGCPASILSCLGDDADGHLVRRRLRSLGVDTRGLRLDPRSRTTVAVCLVERGSGERRFLVADRRVLERRAPRLDLGSIRRGTILMLDGHFPDQALRAARRARQVGAPVVGDFHRLEVARRLLPYVDYPIVPEELCRSLPVAGPRQALRWLAERSTGTPIVTLGRRGALALREGRFQAIPARRVRVRDTTGAGDAFHGAFAAGLAHGLDFDASVALASRAAARCCTALGGTGALLRREEVAALRESASRGGRSRGRGASRRPSGA